MCRKVEPALLVEINGRRAIIEIANQPDADEPSVSKSFLKHARILPNVAKFGTETADQELESGKHMFVAPPAGIMLLRQQGKLIARSKPASWWEVGNG